MQQPPDRQPQPMPSVPAEQAKPIQPAMPAAPIEPVAPAGAPLAVDGVLPLPPGWTPPPSWVAARERAARRSTRLRIIPRRLGWWLGALVLLAFIVVPLPPSTTDLLAAAASARAAYRYDRALAFYARAAQQDPNDSRPVCQTATVLALQQLYDQAAAAYNHCQALGDHGPQPWLALGDIAQTRGNLAQAEHFWLRAASIGSSDAHHRLGMLYEQQARFDDAAAQWRALPASDPLGLVHIALLALRTGDYPTARKAFIAAQNLPGFAGQDAVDQGFVQLAAFGPQTSVGLTSIGVTFVQNNLPTLARLPLQRALAIDPTNGPAHAYLAWVEYLAQDTTDAQADAAQALALAPNDPFTLFVVAEQAMAASQWTTAAADLDLALGFDNKNAELWAERGRAALGIFDYLHAELSYGNAARLSDDPAFTISYLSFYVRYRVGFNEGTAQQAAVQATLRWSANAQVQLLAAQIFDFAGQPTLAYGAYQRANQDDPGEPLPYFAFAQSALADGNLVLAAFELRTTLALQPAGPLSARARALLAPLASYNV